jgi:hypothetical protein
MTIHALAPLALTARQDTAALLLVNAHQVVVALRHQVHLMMDVIVKMMLSVGLVHVGVIFVNQAVI